MIMASTAIINTSNYNHKSIFIQERPLMLLKDHLLDDLSSCSSSGFKSFPRRQCCNTVRFLLEIDLNNNIPKQPQHPKFKRSISAPSATISALQKASKAFVNAVKLLPFPSSSSVKSPSVSHRKKNRKGVLGLLPRSISRKLFKNRKAEHIIEIGEIREWKSFREFLEEEKPSPGQISSAGSFTCSGDSTSSSCSNSGDSSWTESRFSESLRVRNDAGGLLSEKKVGDGASEAVGGDSVAYSVENAKEWTNEEEKEQLSPVSVLDCPFQDDEEENTLSPFQRSLLCLEGSKHKILVKTRKLESIAGINPVNLEQQIEEDQYANELLNVVKAKLPLKNHLQYKADSLLVDFFKEKMVEKKGSMEFDEEIEIANKWLNGEAEEMYLGWEVKDKRHFYIKDMERNGKWRNFDDDKQELAFELELQIFTSLLNEALSGLCAIDG